MKRKILSLILAVLMLFPASVLAYGADEEPSVQRIVYDFLTEELELSPAAAAGIMGNVMIECGFDPDIEHMDTNDKLSYGLMMWNGPRYEALKEWCTEHGYEKSDPMGQLTYLKWELENTEKAAYKYVKDVPNTIEGAAQAAILWADKFERCTKTSYGLRVYYALNNYWQTYAGGTVSSTPGIYGYYYNVPDNIKHGEPLTLYGAVVSYSSNLQSVTAGVYTEDGQLVTGKTISASNLAGNIGVIDRYVVINKLPKGSYYYTITAVNASGEYIVERHSFTVSDEPTKVTLVPESEGGVICELGASCPQLQFNDMRPAVHWAHGAIDHVLTEGYFLGNGSGSFLPEDGMTRAMFVTVLHRLSDKLGLIGAASEEVIDEDPEAVGDAEEATEATEATETTEPAVAEAEASASGATAEPIADEATDGTYTDGEATEGENKGENEGEADDGAAEGSDPGDNTDDGAAEGSDPVDNTDDGAADAPVFTDVPEDAWFAEHVMWAYENGLVTGVSEGIFAPDRVISRGELAVLMYRVAEASGIDVTERGDLAEFADGDTLPEWAAEEMAFAVSAGLINGSLSEGEAYLNCSASASREQVATIIVRFSDYAREAADADGDSDHAEVDCDCECHKKHD